MKLNLVDKVMAARRLIIERSATLEAMAGKPVFVTGLLVFLAFYMSQIVFPIFYRNAPVEPDDAYTYIVKASQMRHCFLQDCVSLESLAGQYADITSNTAAKDIRNGRRWEDFNRIFILYHPLHSAIMSAFSLAGLKWEQGWNVTGMLCALVLVSGVAALFHSLWGPAAAGISLAVMALQTMPNQGFLTFAPSNLALGLAMWVWLGALKGVSRFAALAGIAALCLAHWSGVVYAVAVLGISATRFGVANSWKSILAPGSAVILFWLVLPHLAGRPFLFGSIATSIPANYDYFIEVAKNVGIIGDAALGIARLPGGALLTPVILFAGLLAAPGDSRGKRMAAVVAVVTAMMIASLFYVLPNYPAKLSGRIFVPFAIVMTGLFGWAVWVYLAAAFAALGAAMGAGSFFKRMAAGVTAAALAGGGGFYANGAYRRSIDSLWDLRWNMETMLSRQNIWLDSSQPLELLRQAEKGDTVLYTWHVGMQYFLTHGAWDLATIYSDAISRDAKAPVIPRDKMLFTVSVNPLANIPAWEQGGLLLNPDVEISISRGAVSGSGNLELYVVNPWKDANLFADTMDNGVHKALTVKFPAGFSGWAPIASYRGAPPLDMAVKTDGWMYVRGIRGDPAASTQWPWRENITVGFKRLLKKPRDIVRLWDKGIFVRQAKDNIHEAEVNLASENILRAATPVSDVISGYCGGLPGVVDVISDKGHLVLGKVVCQNQL